MKAFIAVTVGEFINEKEWWVPPVHGQSHTYFDAIVDAGGAPFMMPAINNEAALKQLYQQADGLLLTGGADLAPEICGEICPPGEKPCLLHDKPVSPRRDKQEIKLLKWALRDKKPILGICRGMQIMNAALGGSLYHDLKTDLPSAQNHEANIHKQDFLHLSHCLQIKPGSKLAAILGTDKISTNSLHHQAIRRLGKGLAATAHTDDGVIEAIELSGRAFVLGVQSHPEALEARIEPLWRELFKAFVKSAADFGRTKPEGPQASAKRPAHRR